MLDTLASEKENLFIKTNAENTCNNVFKHKNKINSAALTLPGYPLKYVSEYFYLSIVLMDNLACTSGVEPSENVFFFLQHNSVHVKFSQVETNVLYIFLNACHVIL